jgi:hypothetical protein
MYHQNYAMLQSLQITVSYTKITTEKFRSCNTKNHQFSSTQDIKILHQKLLENLICNYCFHFKYSVK